MGDRLEFAKPLDTPPVDEARLVFGEARAPIPALTMVEVALWATGTTGEDAAARAALDDREIEAALSDASCWMPFDLAQRLSQAKGLFVPASLVAERIAADPRLQDLQRAAEHTALQVALGKADEFKRQLKIEQEQRRERNYGPRCGARTRAGGACQRKVVLGRTRCPAHGGKPLTTDARARIVEAQRRRWAAYREARLLRTFSSPLRARPRHGGYPVAWGG